MTNHQNNIMQTIITFMQDADSTEQQFAIAASFMSDIDNDDMNQESWEDAEMFMSEMGMI